MKKIININFQGRVIPIEETAYETLQQYVESLRRYFANEEGRDEIINDIESRIAELFSERLKRDTACISDDDVNAIMASIGRPEDFGDQDTNTSSTSSSSSTGNQQSGFQPQAPASGPTGRGRLYRNADDKILGGVCSGLANYLGIDPVILRIVFVLLIGALFWVYILLWIIVPSQSLQTNITKRLYRNPDDKVLAGVCGGLSSYFNIDVWVPRLIFALPLIIGVISGTLNAIWWNWDFGFTPRMITGSLGSTLFITYIILWIAVPYAATASEKLEMRGERVDLNSIRDTVKEDLQNFKTKTEKFGQEVKQTAQQFGNRAKDFGQSAASHAKTFSTTEAAPVARRARSGVGHAIGILFKAFFLFIAGVVAVGLFGVLLALVFGGMATFPLKNFILEGTGQNMLAWCTLIFFLGVPLVALITWLVRRIMGVRSRNHYLGYVFGVLWLLGLFCFIFLIGTFGRNFKSRDWVEEKINVAPVNTLVIDVSPTRLEYYHGENFFGLHWDDDLPVYGSNMDTLQLNTVRVNIAKSKDSSFHVTKISLSRGNTREKARTNAAKIRFDITQQDSVLLLPPGFPISNTDKFRNQQVAVVIEVPVGKRIRLNRRVERYDWFNINMSNRRGWNTNWDDNWDNTYGWDAEVDYIMTPDGLHRVSEMDPIELKNGHFKVIPKNDEDEDGIPDDRERGDKDKRLNYRYKQLEDSIKQKAKDQLREELRIKDSLEREKKVKEAMKSNTLNTKKTVRDNDSEEEPLPDSRNAMPVLIFTKLLQ